MGIWKNNIVLGSLMICVLLGITSCGTSDTVTVDATTEVEIMGTVQKGSGGKQFMLSTDGKDVELVSSTVSLEEYVEKPVRVKGVYKDDASTIFEVRSVVISTSNNNTSIPSEYTTFESDTMGISFRHPISWVSKILDDAKVRFVTKDNAEFIMEIYTITPKQRQSLQQWIGSNYKNADILETVFGGIAGHRVVTDNSEEELVIVGQSGLFYTIRFSYTGTELDKNKTVRDFSEIGNTFTFFVPGSRIPPVEELTNSNSNTEETIPTETPANSNTQKPTENKNKNISSSDSIIVSEAPVTTANTNTNVVTPSVEKPQVATDTSPLLAYMKEQNYLLPSTIDKTAVSKVEVADGKYVYVTYTDGEGTKKVVYTVDENAGSYTAQETGSFLMDSAAGKWTTITGVNPAPNTARQVYTISSGAVAQKTTSATGQTVYTNASTGIAVQYPKNWYYEGSVLQEKGGLQQVTFTNKPADQDPTDTVVLKVYKGGTIPLDDSTITLVNGVAAYPVEKDGATSYVVKGKDGNLYATSGSNPIEMGNILKSVQ